MKKKIIVTILGSTGSIGETLLETINLNHNKFKIILLTTNKNYKKVFKQAKTFNVKNIIIKDEKSYLKAKSYKKYRKYNIFNDFFCFKKIFKIKADYTMSAISGIEGLIPTIEIIKYTKKIAIANKESIICGWFLIKKELQKYNVNFIPVDSEHFSMWFGLKNLKIDYVKKIYLTASGGPFLRLNRKKLNQIKISDALNHPNWKMGKKISIDSATMMNKVFEIIEAKKIFNIPYTKLSILIHPNSYIHAIIVFKNGMIKIIAHETSMTIPIMNSLDENMMLNLTSPLKSSQLSLKNLNNLNMKQINPVQFPLIKILNKLPHNDTLLDTVIVAANDELVNLYLKGKINFTDIDKFLLRFLRNKNISKFKSIKSNNIEQINYLNKYVRLNLNKNIYR